MSNKLMKETTIEDLKAGEKYVSFKFEMGLTDVQNTFCFDQSKANMLYLVEPRVDTEGIAAARDNPIAADIDSRMDGPTWWELKKLPLTFLEYWFRVDNGITALASHWPPNYKALMTERAHAAQKRLLGVVEEGNVKRANFHRLSGDTPLQAGSRAVTPATSSDLATIRSLSSKTASRRKFGHFEDNEDGTVTDSRTGLMWTRYVLGQAWDGSKPVGNWRDYPWAEAVALRHSFAGHDDWRLPTVDELEKIVELNHNPPFDAAAFPNFMPFGCWTVSPYGGKPTHAWFVDFKTGGRKCAYRSESHLVRLVRRYGQSSTPPDLDVVVSRAASSLLPDSHSEPSTPDMGRHGELTSAEQPHEAQADTSKDMPTDVARADDSVLAEVAEVHFKLGKKFHNGDGVKRDYEKAVEYYRKSAQKGHAKSQNNLGLMCSSGHGVPQDHQEAARWYLKAAEQGLVIAQNNLASLYLRGSGVSQDDQKAVEWYRKAADQGNPDAQFSLAEMFEKGRGVPQDDEQAKALYLQAALQDDEAAQCWLWKRAQVEKTQPAALLMESTTAAVSDQRIVQIPTESALAIIRAAIELLKHNPTSFSPELADLRALLLTTAGARVVENVPPKPPKSESIPASAEEPALRVARWLSGLDSIGWAELRSELLPLDLLPAALIDEINEKALELTGDIALEHIDDEIVVCKEILAQVLHAED